MSSTKLHTYHDGSSLMLSTVYNLMKIPNWRGNRILDTDHAKKLQSTVENVQLLDKGYYVIVVPETDAGGNVIEQRYIVDGQHRLSILKEARETGFFPDFPVTYIEKVVESESEAIEYFNTINSMKPMPPQDEDSTPETVINRCIVALEKEFNTSKKKTDWCLRATETRRPFLCVHDIRPLLHSNMGRLRLVKPTEFARRVRAWNDKKVEEIELQMAMTIGVPPIRIKCHERRFVLALDPKLPWILACLP